jgi:UDP-3-O-[3-hydroxymyristoyl] glucosamine N-acyltransferase
MKLYTAQDIATLLNGDMVGSTTQTISSPEQLELAANDQISFIGNKKYEKLWATSKAPIAVVTATFL